MGNKKRIAKPKQRLTPKPKAGHPDPDFDRGDLTGLPVDRDEKETKEDEEGDGTRV